MQSLNNANAMVTMAVKKGRSSDLYYSNGKFEIKKGTEVLYTYETKQEVIDHIMTHGDLIPDSLVPASKDSSTAISDLVSKFSARTHNLAVLPPESSISPQKASENVEDDTDDSSEEVDEDPSDASEELSSDEDSEELSPVELSDEDDEPEEEKPVKKTSGQLDFSLDFSSTPDSSTSKNKKKSAQDIANEAIGISVDGKTSKSKSSQTTSPKASTAEKPAEKASAKKASGKKASDKKKGKGKTSGKKAAEVLGTMESKEKMKKKLEGKDIAPTKEPAAKKDRKKKEVFEKETEVDLVTSLGYSPKDVRQEKKPMTVQLLVERMKNNEIDWKTFFQRSPDMWTPIQKSKLIESIFMGIHINPLVFDAANPNNWLVVDGLQRLSTIRHFVIGMMKSTKTGMMKSKLKLTGLRGLPDLNGKTYESLPRELQRQLNEYAFDTTILLEGTPDEVKFEIFERTNTGGLKLSEQEIRNALYRGPMTQLIREIIEEGVFGQTTHELISAKRSADQEMILRHFAVRVFYSEYTGDNKMFFNKALKEFNKYSPEKLKDLESDFVDALVTAYKIWDRYTFRKVTYGKDIKDSYQFSRTLYEVISVCLANLPRESRDRLVEMKEDVRAAFDYMFNDETEFVNSLSIRTNDPKVMRTRMQYVKDAFDDLLAGTFFAPSEETSTSDVESSEEKVEEPSETQSVEAQDESSQDDSESEAKSDDESEDDAPEEDESGEDTDKSEDSSDE